MLPKSSGNLLIKKELLTVIPSSHHPLQISPFWHRYNDEILKVLNCVKTMVYQSDFYLEEQEKVAEDQVKLIR